MPNDSNGTTSGTSGANGAANGATAGTTATHGDAHAELLTSFRDELRSLYNAENVPDRERKLNHRLFKLRLKNRGLEEEIGQLRGQTPADGSLVLTKEDAAEFAEFKKLAMKPADLKTALDEHAKLKGEKDERSIDQLWADAAAELGFENVPLFTRMLKREGLHLEFRDERAKDDETGKTTVVRVPMVRAAKDDKAQLESLDDYVEREFGDAAIVAFETAPATGEETDDEDDIAESTVGAASRRGTRRERTVGASNGASHGGSNGASQTIAGVRIPVTRNARPLTSERRSQKKDDEALQQKRVAGGYRL